MVRVGGLCPSMWHGGPLESPPIPTNCSSACPVHGLLQPPFTSSWNAPSANSGRTTTRSTPRPSSTTTSATTPSPTPSTASGCPGIKPSPATRPAATPGTSCVPLSWHVLPTATGAPNSVTPLLTPSPCRTGPNWPTTQTSSPKRSSFSPRSVACPTASSTSSSCVACAASPTRPPRPSRVPPWPPPAPTNATPPASWTASSPRPARRDHLVSHIEERLSRALLVRNRTIPPRSRSPSRNTRARSCPARLTQRGGRRPARPVRNPSHSHPAHRRRRLPHRSGPRAPQRPRPCPRPASVGHR